MAERILEVAGPRASASAASPRSTRVSLHLGEGERLGLIGPNGSGKTTLINCISGALPCDGGRVLFKGQDITRAAGAPARAPRHHAQLPDPAPVPQHDGAREPVRAAGVRAPRARPRPATCEDEAHGDPRAGRLRRTARDESSADLTQVELRKLELARALAAEPALLVADEAMAGLSSAEVDDILAILFRLNERGVAVIMIEHIMRAVMRFSERVVVLDAGRKIAEGTPGRGDQRSRGREGVPWRIASRVADVDAGYGAVRVLHDVSMRVDDGETVVLLGSNGNGKSTLIKCITGIVTPSRGRIMLRDRRRARSTWSA